jgi:zeaxanthin glucosyltransferase
VTLLVISPDYASHLIPLLTLAGGWHGDRVVVATGPATAGLVTAAGFEHVELRLGRGSNPGIIRAEQQPTGEDDNLRAFFAATREGMVATLRYQAGARRNDLLWDPVNVGQRVLDIVEEVDPDQVLVDHLAFGATLALRAAGVPFGDVVLGHPSALPVGDEIYGVPPAWPACFHVTADELGELREQGASVRDEFTEAYNQAMHALVPTASEVRDAFAAHGDVVLYNFPADLHDPSRTPRLPEHVFLGSAVRTDEVPDDVNGWLGTGDRRPTVYVSFGTFLSARTDVLAKVADALRPLDVKVAMASGSTDPSALGEIPDHWLVRPFLPQVALLERAAVTVTHGGNNSVTESLTAGVPLLVLPFSTDQFAGAADIERSGVGRALAPNTVSPAEIAEAVSGILAGPERAAAGNLGRRLRALPGPLVARAAVQAPRLAQRSVGPPT